MNPFTRAFSLALFAAGSICTAAAPAVSELPLSFEPNRGQTDSRVRFLARAPGQRIFLTQSGATLFPRGSAAPVNLTFSNSERGLAYSGVQLLPGRVNYFRGADPKLWRAGVPTYAKVRGTGLYAGIDIVYYGNRGRLEYDLEVAAGADPGLVRMRFDGAESVEVEESGDLIVHTAAGRLRQLRPVAYQANGEHRTPVEAAYVISESGEVGIELGGYDRERDLVIDPVIAFSTFLGGGGLEESWAIALDSQGNILIAGGTDSPDYPTTGSANEPAYQSTDFPGDAFVTKLSPDGKSILYSTFLGGRDRDTARAIAVDGTGNAYVAGDTESLNFPTTFGAFQIFNASLIGVFPDGFVTKLSPDGAALVYSTYIGDDYTDQVRGIAVDSQSQAVIAGASDSTRFPVSSGASQLSCAGYGFGAFVSKLSVNGKALVYSTRICGSANDEALAVAVDGSDLTYVAGVTSSVDFPVTAGAHRTTGGESEDGFAAKVASDGRSLVWATYIGGTDADAVTGLAVDGEGNAVLAGSTQSVDFPVTAGALQSQHADQGAFEDAFVAKLNGVGSGLAYSTYLGGSGSDQAMALALDSQAAAYVTGSTSSFDFPVTPALCQTAYGGKRDVFVTRLHPSGASLDYSMLLTGWEDETGLGIASGSSGESYVTGRTWSPNFTTTPGAMRTAYGSGYRGSSDAFVAQVSPGAPPGAPCIALNGFVNGASFLPGPVSPGQIVSFFGYGLGPDTAVLFQPQNGFLPAELAGTRVLFDGIPAPMILSYTGQINAIVPYSVDGAASTVVEIEYLGSKTQSLTLPVAEAVPAVFSQNASGRGAGAILNQDYSTNTPQNRAARNSIVQIFATGEGQTNPSGIDGKIAVSGGLPEPNLPVTVKIGGIDAAVHYAGAAPGLVAGVIQINAQVPGNVASGSAVPIEIRVGSNPSRSPITLAIQ